MGSDSSPLELFQAILEAEKLLSKGDVVVVFTTESLVHDLQHYVKLTNKVEFVPVADEILMSDEPLLAVRKKKKSSLLTGIRHMKKKKIDAFITAGNTGALIASSAISLSLFPGFKRPALLANLPTVSGSVTVIDVGGNVGVKTSQLVKFAFLGAAYRMGFYKIKTPRIGLLNIGVESKKGTEEVQKAFIELLHKSQNKEFPIEFIGNIEARDLFKGEIDVLITDGFTGNILLKTAEGIASFIFDYVFKNAKEGSETLRRMAKEFNYHEYPGAFLCGIDGIIIKCHGNVSRNSLINSILEAKKIKTIHLLDQLKSHLMEAEQILSI